VQRIYYKRINARHLKGTELLLDAASVKMPLE